MPPLEEWLASKAGHIYKLLHALPQAVHQLNCISVPARNSIYILSRTSLSLIKLHLASFHISPFLALLCDLVML